MSEAGEPAGVQQKQGKKRRRKPQAGETVLLPADERDRRERQRRLRALALKLRAQGTEYNAKRHKQHKPRRPVQVIVVPIFWNKKAAEKEAVLGAAAEALELLRGAGVKSDTDTTNELTPGQKFRAWEEKGVLLRLEIGPKEAEAGRCIFARCSTPGEVAQKTTLAVGPKLLAAVRAELGLPADSGPAGGAAAAPAPAAAAPAAAEAAAKDGGARVAGGGAPGRGPSGDDVDGDFGGVRLLPEKSKKKGGKRAAAEADGDDDGGGGAVEEEEPPKKESKKGKKQPKVVKF